MKSLSNYLFLLKIRSFLFLVLFANIPLNLFGQNSSHKNRIKISVERDSLCLLLFSNSKADSNKLCIDFEVYYSSIDSSKMVIANCNTSGSGYINDSLIAVLPKGQVFNKCFYLLDAKSTILFLNLTVGEGRELIFINDLYSIKKRRNGKYKIRSISPKREKKLY